MNQFNLIRQSAGRVIDRLNDSLTSYRLVFYFLLSLVIWAIIGSFFSQVAYSWYQIVYSAIFLAAICWGSNKLLAKSLKIPANKESDLITALILTLIMAPAASGSGLGALAIAGVIAMASKYVITFYKSHLFNPAAAGAYIAGLATHQYAAWWVGTKFMTPLVVIGGILVVRKMKRFTMVGAFLAIYVLYLIFGANGSASVSYIWSALISTQVLFFASIMLPEPQTSPTTLKKYLPYAVVVGIFYSIVKLKVSPEAALLIGNVLTFIIAPKKRYVVKFIQKIPEADGIFSYLFTLPPKLTYKAGQYMEWTLANNRTDSRGNRRYLTISSSPTEPRLMVTVKQPPKNPSAFKQRLDNLKPGDTILASYLAGNFGLPKNKSKKLAFLAGGVGITPFRGMVKYLIDSGEKRDAALLYAADSPAEIAFGGLFKQAKAAGLKVGYLTDRQIDRPAIAVFIPDYAERTFYVSGPYAFVKSIEASLIKMGLPSRQIITDYFPGYGG